MEWIKSILANSTSVYIIMAVIIVAICELIKYPIKKLTGRIQDDGIRKVVNGAIFYPIIFALSLVLVWLYSTYYLQTTLNMTAVGIVSSTAIASYSVIIDQIIKPLVKKFQSDAADGKITVSEVKSTVGLTKEQLQKLKDALNSDEDKK